MVIMMITVSWDVRPSTLVVSYEPFENRVSRLLRNVGNVTRLHGLIAQKTAVFNFEEPV